jgi:Fe-S-cluster containining protein
MEAEEIAEEARNGISRYCIEKCHALCCRYGVLALSNEEVDLLVGKKRKDLEKKGLIHKKNDCVFLLEVGKKACPQLDKKFMCKIHKNPLRPKLCCDFPLFVQRGFVVAAASCPAVNDGTLDKWFEKFREIGYKII